MRVEVVRSGGFAGRVLHWAVDLEDLPADTASELRGLLAEAPHWAGHDGHRAGPPDGFRWRVVTDDHVDLAFAEPAPEPAQRLVELVRSEGASSG
jgi:hypothetical protein